MAFGYVSVIICTLCTSRAVRSYAEARLPGGSLRPLLEAVEEFLQYHRLVDDQGQGPREGETRAGFVSRLQSIVDELKNGGQR